MTTKISPAFRKQFPDMAKRAEEAGITIQAAPGKRVNGMAVFFAEGNYQLTGYTRHADGRDVTLADTRKTIGNTIERIIEGRAKVAGLTVEQRFERCLDRLMVLKPRVNWVVSDHDFSGDEALLASSFGGKFTGQIHLRGVGLVADAEWREGEALETRRLMRASFEARGAKRRAAA